MSSGDRALNTTGRNHFRNVALLWLLATVILTPIVVFVLGPGMPPGNGSVEAHGQVVDNTVLMAIATPVALAVLVYFGYALWAFRERTPDVIQDGPPVRGDSRPTRKLWNFFLYADELVVFRQPFGVGQGADFDLAGGGGGGQVGDEGVFGFA